MISPTLILFRSRVGNLSVCAMARAAVAPCESLFSSPRVIAFSISWIEIEMVPSFSEGASCGTTYRTSSGLRVNQSSSVWGCPSLSGLSSCFNSLPWCLVCIVGSLCFFVRN